MSWGALNNQRDRKSSDPLPDFLMDQAIGTVENNPIRSSGVDDPIIKDPQSFRPDLSSRGYGVSYPKALTLQISKKTIFFTMVFFTFSVLISFATGYLMGSFNSVGASIAQVANQKSGQIHKKPIVPVRKKKLMSAAAKVITDEGSQTARSVDTPERLEGDISKTHTSNNNNRDNDESASGNDEAAFAAFDNKAED